MIDPLFWIAAALLSGIVVMILVRPLLRGGGAAPSAAKDRATSDMAVYKAQLGEVERDLARGVLAPEQAEAARLEIQRRLIRAAEARDAEPVRAAPRAALWGLAAIVPLGALGLYAMLGAPGTPDMPMADRIAAAEARHADDRARFEAMAAELAERMRDRPDDVTGWTMLGRAERVLGRIDASLGAFEKALAAAGGIEAASAELLADIGETHVHSSQGAVDAEALKWFGRAVARDPQNLKARHYLAVARSQAGDDRGALALLRGMAEDAPADAPWLETLQQRIAALESRIGPDAASVQPEVASDAAVTPPGAPAAPGPFGGAVAERGPDRESMAAAADMSPEQRDAFIRSMVQRLAERLESAPDDPDGWVRLGRAHSVLGEPGEARSAFGKAATLWRERLAAMPADAPNRAAVEQRLRQVEELL